MVPTVSILTESRLKTKIKNITQIKDETHKYNNEKKSLSFIYFKKGEM